MGATYTTALERDVRRSSAETHLFDARHVLLPLTSLVAILAIALAYNGRVRTASAWAAPQRAADVINLNTVVKASTLERPLELVFADASPRRAAAIALFQHVVALRSRGHAVPNVGAIANARVLTPNQLAAVKPSLIVRTHDVFRRTTVWYAGLYLAAFYVVLLLWWLRGVSGEPVLLAAAHLLTAIGFAIALTRPDPLRDTMIVTRYTEGVVVGLGAMVLVSLVDFRRAAFLRFSYLPLIAALGLSLVLVVLGTGPGNSSAKVNLGPVQPIEAIRLLLALFLAGYFARRWELLSQLRTGMIRNSRVPAWLHMPRVDYVLPLLAGVMAALAFFFLQKDLGPALLVSCVFLALYAVARRRVTMALSGLLLLVAGFYLGYRWNISTTLADRVRIWQSPWDNGVRGGDQIAQSIWALSTGGVFGTGLGFGDTRYLPAGSTDLVLAAIGEELGAAGLLAIAVIYAVIGWRGFRIALRAGSDYGFFLATAITLFLIVPVIVMAAGTLGVTPLTGVVTPFLSYGGSAMAANFAALGMLMGIAEHHGGSDTSEPFRKPIRWLRGVLALATIGLVAGVLDVQVLHADRYLVQPHLSLQADGVRRNQYNPRVLDVARLIPRGTIYDRRGLPLATSDATTFAKARETYAKLGVTPGVTCTEPIERCYPLADEAFHVLGDATSRMNWGASNTSYVERDAYDRLRGYEHHRELIPLLRHRHDHDHPDVKRLLTRAHDVRVTVDANLQHRLAGILVNYAKSSATHRAAAIVIDAASGDILALASYPSPQLTQQAAGTSGNADTLLDRARYGLYTPGSTFKLVTAIAALRRDIALSEKTFMCTLLSDGRAGARIPGGRPVRDDILDRHPHGTIDMHDAMVQSCNAYFGQLALRVGPEALLDTARRLGISITSGNSAQRLRGALPETGFGQGEVLATPLRLARVAAALASGGSLPDVRVIAEPAARAKTELLLPRAASDLLAAYMRDVVINGTGRSLRANPWRIAGKTGTAELAGAPSHAWFVGFAPYGPATKRIAFAVIIENAGYGGRAAAPVAGEIVNAAAAAGLLQP
jgi:cell division protein FtsI/penicillin-binding protein 2/cell division protein FtsW (lipid II flippase)